VLTRNRRWSAPGATVAHHPDDAARPDFWVIGGAALYAAFLPYAGHIVRTRIDLSVPGDVFAPQVGDDWVVTAAVRHEAPTGVAYTVEDLVRRDAGKNLA
jgi:dihydrofolate reductase